MDILLDKLRTKVRDLSAKPEKFLEVQDDVFEASKWVAKAIYDCTKAGENTLYTADQSRMSLKSAPSTLPELIVEEFDEEQVFAGVEWQNRFVLEELDRQMESIAAEGKNWSLLLSQGHSRKRKESSSDEDEDFQDVLAKKKKKQGPYEAPHSESDQEVDDEDNEEEEAEEEGEEPEEEEEENEEAEDGEDKETDSIFDDPDFQNMSDSDGDDLPLFDNPDSDASDDDNDKKADQKAAEKEKKSILLEKQADDYMEQAMKNLRGRGRSEVEDKFFSLSDMEKFLDQEDKAADRKLKKEDDDDDNEGIDYFEDSDGNEEEGRAKYSDYFNDAEAGNELKATSKAAKKGKVAFDILQDEDNDENEEEEERDLGEVKSTFEEQQTKLKKKIKKMEEEAVTDKPWQMKGEIAGPARPENSLLEEHLDYDTVAKHAPIITEAVSRRLEDIILRRIKDKAWDDVERKIKPVEDPYEYKKKLVLDQEKSKLSLAEIYEQEYLKLKQGELDKKKKVSVLDHEDEKEIPKEVEEIKRKMKSLFAKLDTLSHFHYTPKQISAEVKIVRNMPSIAMEDVAPVGTSEATLLAPQEMLERKTDSQLTARSELTDTDRKRERRNKKAKQRAVQKEKEKRQKIADKLNPGLGNKYSKQKIIKELEQAEKKGNLTLIKDKGKDRAVKSSTAFFDALQDDANSAIKNKRPEQAKKSVKASSLKL